MFYFISILTLFFKFNRLIFLLLGLEMLVMGLVFDYCVFMGGLLFFFFICFVVISSVTGLFVFICSMKSYGSDSSFLFFKFDFGFCRIKMNIT